MAQCRNIYMDLIKGFAIWLVVFGHSLQTFYPNWQESYFGRAIYMFHMPLFMAVSGYFFYPSVNRYTLKSFFIKKLLRLYLPSFCWGKISIIILFLGDIYLHKNPNISLNLHTIFSGMWFLNVLFILSIIGSLIEHFLGKYKYIFWLLTFIVIYLLPSNPTINEMKFLIPFFVLAMSCRKYQWQRIPSWLFIISAICFVFLLKIYTFDYSLYNMGNDIFTYQYNYISMIRFFSGLSGIICSLYICKLIYQLSVIRKYFVYIGSITLPIYVLNERFLLPFIHVHVSICNVLVIIAISIVVVFLSMLVYKLLSNRWIRLCLFGEEAMVSKLANSSK